ncbi:MAG TPA: hypothetical protein VFG23_02775 [Polyangia bacterium]|nr:hypothetical protein [Polyangia bacterium]
MTAGRMRVEIERRWPLVAVLALAPQVACGSSAAPHLDVQGNDAAAIEGGSDSLDAGCGAEPSLGIPSPTCNAIANGAPSVAFTAESAALPAFTGGQIADGLYFATDVVGYGTVTPAGRRLTLAVTGGGTAFFWNGQVLDGTAEDIEETFAANATATASGSTLTLTTTCASVSPSPLPPSMSYTASTTTLALAVFTGAGNAAVTTYTWQGCLSRAPLDAGGS